MFLNYFLWIAYLIAIVNPCPKYFQAVSNKCYLIKNIDACQILSSPIFLKLPFSSNYEYLESIFTLGTLTCSNLRYPLSFELNPNFAPMSPTNIPGSGSWVFVHLIGTTKIWIPYLFPSTISWAYVTTCVAVIPMSDPHHFVAPRFGVWMMNSFVDLSKVAVVSRLFTSDPCANSVYE